MDRRTLLRELVALLVLAPLAACGGGSGGGGGGDGSGGGSSAPALIEVVNSPLSAGEITWIDYAYSGVIDPPLPPGSQRFTVGLDPGDAYTFAERPRTYPIEIRVRWFDGSDSVAYRGFVGGIDGVVSSGGPGVTRITMTKP